MEGLSQDPPILLQALWQIGGPGRDKPDVFGQLPSEIRSRFLDTALQYPIDSYMSIPEYGFTVFSIHCSSCGMGLVGGKFNR